MVKHGGGYVILDVRGATANESGGIFVTPEQADVITSAYREKLPVLYIGPGDALGRISPPGYTVASFTMVEDGCSDYGAGGKIAIYIPQVGQISATPWGYYLDGNELVPYTV